MKSNHIILFKLAFASIIVFGLDEDVCEWVCAGYMSGGNAWAYFLEVSPLPTTARTNEYFQLEHLNFKPPTSNIYSTCKQGTIKRHSSSVKSFAHHSQTFPQTGIIDQDQGSGSGDLGSGMLGTGTGVHFLFDVLPSWADQGSCAHKCVC